MKTVLSEYRIANADITVREDATVDDLIDVVEGNRYSLQTESLFVPVIQLFQLRLPFQKRKL